MPQVKVLGLISVKGIMLMLLISTIVIVFSTVILIAKDDGSVSKKTAIENRRHAVQMLLHQEGVRD